MKRIRLKSRVADILWNSLTFEAGVSEMVKFIQNNYRRRKRGVAVVAIACLLIMGQAVAWAETDPVLCVIGEAENQGYEGMLAVSEAMRNRGTIKGVLGCRSERVLKKMYSEATFDMAQRAWLDSALPYDITHGATHWENVKAFGNPSWANRMIETAQIGDHVFYKEAR